MLQEYPDFDDNLKMMSKGTNVDCNVALPSTCFHISTDSAAISHIPPSLGKAARVALAVEEEEEAKVCVMDQNFDGNPDQAWSASVHETYVASKDAGAESVPFSSWIEFSPLDGSLAAETLGSTYNDTSDEDSDSSEGDSVYELFDDVSVLTADSTIEAIEVQEEHLEEADLVQEYDRFASKEECKNEEEIFALKKQESEEQIAAPESIFAQTHHLENGSSFQYDLRVIMQDQPVTHRAIDDSDLMSFLVNLCSARGR